MQKFIHWIAHLFGWNTGKVATWMEDDMICVGFECEGCGEIDPKTIDKVRARDVIPTDDKWMEMEVADE